MNEILITIGQIIFIVIKFSFFSPGIANLYIRSTSSWWCLGIPSWLECYSQVSQVFSKSSCIWYVLVVFLCLTLLNAVKFLELKLETAISLRHSKGL